MNLQRKCLPATALLCSVALTSCGVSTVPSTSLNGNWNIAGNVVSGQFPALSAAIVVTGNEVTASLTDTIQCTPNSGSGGSSTQLTGVIGSDGSFTMTTVPPVQGSVAYYTQFTLSGRVPENANDTWSGSYSIVNNSTGCVVNQTGPFTAVRFAPVTGTYAGTASSSNLGSNVTLTAQIKQATSPTAASGPNTLVSAFFALSGTLSVSGSSCFTSGTSSGNVSGMVVGSDYSQGFLMNDGSRLWISGNVSDTTAAQIVGPFGPEGATFNIYGGSCNGKWGYVTLTKQ